MRLQLLVTVLVLILVAGCAPRHARIKDEQNALLTGNTWEVNRGMMLAGERSRNFAVAINAGEQELAVRPDNHEARIMLARLQSRSGRADQALATLAKIPADKQQSDFYLEKMRALIASNKPHEAVAQMQHIDATDKLFREFEKLRAVANDLMGCHPEAQAIYSTLLGEREDAAVRFNYGRSLIASGSFAQAASVLGPMVDNPDYPQARILAAGSLMRAGNIPAARSLLQGYLSDPEIDQLILRGGAS